MNFSQELEYISTYERSFITLREEVATVDKGDEKAVRELFKKMQRLRVTLKKDAKMLRDGAIAFQKMVITREKELLAITEGEEAELKGILDGIKEAREKELRKETLPLRKLELGQLGIVVPTDEELLELDDKAFNDFKLAKLQEIAVAKAEADAKAREEENRATLEAEAEQRAKEKLEREAEEKRIAEEKEQARLNANKQYQAWLAENNYDETTDRVITEIVNGRQVRTLYRLVAQYKD